VSLLNTKYYSGDDIKKNETCGACGQYGEQKRCIQFLVGRLI